MLPDEVEDIFQTDDNAEQSELNELATMSMAFIDQRLEDIDYVRNLIEGILLISPEPIEIAKISKSLGIKRAVADRAAHILVEEYSRKGIIIQEIGSGLQLGTNPDIAEHLEQFFQIERRRRISKAALQTLSIIAYNQPVTRAEIESFRGGINSGGVLQSLLDRDLVKIAGRKETPGTPYLYSVSDEFLRYFGLKTIEELKEKLPAVEDELAKDGGQSQLKLKDLGFRNNSNQKEDSPVKVEETEERDNLKETIADETADESTAN